MDMKLFCVWCGGRLASEDKHVECPECGTEFSNLLVSEASYETTDSAFLETGISFDCVRVEGRHPEEYAVQAKEAAIIC